MRTAHALGAFCCSHLALSRRGHMPAGPQSRHSYNQITIGGAAWDAASALAQILALAWVGE
jgi:hypothetical protein